MIHYDIPRAEKRTHISFTLCEKPKERLEAILWTTTYASARAQRDHHPAHFFSRIKFFKINFQLRYYRNNVQKTAKMLPIHYNFFLYKSLPTLRSPHVPPPFGRPGWGL